MPVLTVITGAISLVVAVCSVAGIAFDPAPWQAVVPAASLFAAAYSYSRAKVKSSRAMAITPTASAATIYWTPYTYNSDASMTQVVGRYRYCCTSGAVVHAARRLIHRPGTTDNREALPSRAREVSQPRAMNRPNRQDPSHREEVHHAHRTLRPPVRRRLLCRARRRAR